MTRYDAVAGHPLAGVPQEVLDVARDTLAQGASEVRFTDGTDAYDADVQAVADAIVQNLHAAGFIRWPVLAPSRSELIGALAVCQREWEQGDQVDESATLLEHIVDDVVLPLVRARWIVPPGALPDRESLVLACQAAAAWRPDEGSSVMEAIVDEVVLPQLRRFNGDKKLQVLPPR